MEEEKLKEATDLFKELIEACMHPESFMFCFSEESNIRETCDKVNDFCRLLRDAKNSSGRKWPQFCERFSMRARFCEGRDSRIVVPFLYTYLEKVGIIVYHLKNSDYIRSIGLGLGDDARFNTPMTQNEKNEAVFRLAVELLESKSPRLLTIDEKAEIYYDIQVKMDNASFLRNMNSLCFARETRKSYPGDDVGSEKCKFIIESLFCVVETLIEMATSDKK